MNGSRLLHLSLTLLVALVAGAPAFGQPDGGGPATIARGSGDLPPIRTLVAYQSKYGSTRQYAQWIHEESGGDLVDMDRDDLRDLSEYDIVIIGSPVRIGRIVIAPFIEDHWNILKEKAVILFTTSATPPRHPKIREIYDQSLPGEIRPAITYFPLHGRVSPERLTLWDRFLIAAGKVMEQDETLKKDMGKAFDGVRRESLSPLLARLAEIRLALAGKK